MQATAITYDEQWLGIYASSSRCSQIPCFYEPNVEETLVYEFSAHDTTELLTLLSEFAFSDIAVFISVDKFDVDLLE